MQLDDTDGMFEQDHVVLPVLKFQGGGHEVLLERDDYGVIERDGVVVDHGGIVGIAEVELLVGVKREVFGAYEASRPDVEV